MNPNDVIRTAVHGSTDRPDVTWAGPNPFTEGLCLGFDNGGIVLSDSTTGYDVSKLQQFSPTGDAINGVAAIGTSSLAVSTRSDVSFIQVKSPTDNRRAVFAGGAHGVVATVSGYFVAPLGPKGLLVVKPTNDLHQRMEMTERTEGRLYFYRVAALHDGRGTETLIFANRKNGVGLSVFKGTEKRRNVNTMGFEGIDVVDVCGVAPNSLAAIAITKTGELLWIRDTSKRDAPIVIKPAKLDGPVYRVLATPQHLFVLSNKALYIWINFVARARSGQFISPDMVRLELPVEAVDMSLIEDKTLILVMGVNAISTFAISDLERQSTGEDVTQLGSDFTLSKQDNAGLSEIARVWQTADVEQVMAGV
jgi:hypothetical protein